MLKKKTLFKRTMWDEKNFRLHGLNVNEQTD